MKQKSAFIETVGAIVKALEDQNLSPVLVGGMALVIMGSSRVTKDFDLLIHSQELDASAVLKIFYDKGFELASKLDDKGNIVRTVDNLYVASSRVRIDKPDSIYLINSKTGLRIDLLFDFPLPAQELAARATKKKIRSYNFLIASKEDLLKLKKIAYKNRGKATDAQDMEFLKKL